LQARGPDRGAGSTGKTVRRAAPRKAACRKTTTKRRKTTITRARKRGLTRKQIAAGFGGKAAQRRLKG
ncbi:unnamed protein product, partial [marine sediment metagenome]